MDRHFAVTKLLSFLVIALAIEAHGQLKAQPPSVTVAIPPRSLVNPVSPVLAQAQLAYSNAFALEQSGDPASVDYYYAAVAHAWFAMDLPTLPSQDPQAWAIYHDSLVRLIVLGQRYGRLDPRRGLTINTASGPIFVPTRYFGFSWKPEDFHQLLVVGAYRPERPRQIYRRAGLGVPLIVMRYHGGNDGLFRRQHVFSATVILRPNRTPSTAILRDVGPSLDFYDSVRIRRVAFAGSDMEMAADTTAALALGASQDERQRLRDRLLPGSSANPPQLHFLEPYRPGKIPVIFVHGLLSDPATWADPANTLLATPQVIERFQIWAFRYPTVDPFLASAASLREQLHQAVAEIDPLGNDPALRQMVLVGHSMGGLVSKLQVTYSGDLIWRYFSNRPLETIVADERTKARLRRDFFFAPSPYVRRVVFIGTPHGGSSLASQWIGRLGSWCVPAAPEMEQMHKLLVQYNPDAFAPYVATSFPNSIDLLEPSSPLLAAMKQLPLNPQVQVHSIIGYGHPMLSSGDSDGVVPISSARHPGAQTETFVRAWHTELHSHPQTLQTLLYILSMHYAEYEAITVMSNGKSGTMSVK